MRQIAKLILLAAVAAATPLWAADVNDVKARQRWPWNGLVDITCTVSGINGTDYGLDFAVAAVMPDSSVHNATNFWVAKDGKKSPVQGVCSNGNYRLIWDARADLGPELYSNVVVRVTVVSGHARAQLWEGGPYWAMTNVGAENPEGYGLYFWWGDTIGYKQENWHWVASNGSVSGFSFEAGFSVEEENTYGRNLSMLQSEGWITADGVLAPEHDAAHVHWGGGWRMPTKQELDDLVSKCNWVWTTVNGVDGYTITGKDSASIFLPCDGFGSGGTLYEDGSDGYYWSSVPHSDDDSIAWDLGFDSSGRSTGSYYNYRDMGRSVRPVQGFASTAVSFPAGIAGDSAPILLDTLEGPRNSLGDETLTYSSLWNGGDGATVTIEQDGEAIAENLAGEGERAWSVPYNGTYELTHVTYTNGVAGKVETAKFVVTGKAEPPEITDVVATPSEPWDGRVSISFNVVNSPAAACPDWNRPYLSIVATDNVTGSNYVSSAAALSARAPYQLGDALAGSNGTHAVTWDFKAQGIDFASTNVTFTVAYLRMPDWCVIDLSGGKDAAHYPVTYVSNVPKVSNVPNVPGVTFNADAYKTTNLVMRLVGPGTFQMGGTTETEITNAFYCAVFETTQRQWELVTGKRPSYFTNETCYATRPVEKVSWNMIRGDANTYNWPNVQGVASDSFVGVLRLKTGLAALDLPAEAQWEYACRAGTRTDFNNDKNMTGDAYDTNLNEVGRYRNNGGSGSSDSCATDHGTAAVGSYLPNAWGLYDMHGNVLEWCLNPLGRISSASNASRVLRGGSWSSGADSCTSSGRSYGLPSYSDGKSGFRLARTLSNNFESERGAEAAAGAERAGTVCAGMSPAIAIIPLKPFEDGDVKLTDYAGEYDGEGHTIGVETTAIAGLELRYAVGDGGSPGGLALPFGDVVPLFTNVCEATVWVEASAPGYIAFTTNATVKITKAPLTITAKDQTYRYNGMQQGESDPIYATPEQIAEKVVVEGLKGTDTLTSITLEGAETAPGVYGGKIEVTGLMINNDFAAKDNYDISRVPGTLTILAPAEVADVVATPTPESPWDGKVSLSFTVTNSPAFGLPNWNAPFLSIVATDNETGSNYVSVASALSADPPEGLAAALHGSNGTHRVTWDMGAQGIKFASTNVIFTVAYLTLPDYCIIDLSGGSNATSYAVTYVSNVPNVPGGTFNTDLYKTTNLVMRLIGPGTFTMGASSVAADHNPPHEVTLTQPFYCAVFETTQKQWELVTGGNPSQSPGGTRPVEKVSYNAIRGKTEGAKWPATNSVDEASFLGVLRLKTGLAALDLPTEAQWEYACRAGSENQFNGVDTQNINLLGRYADNQSDGRGGYSSKHTAVGSYAPNAWGLYDMHGNVYEWCLDWYDDWGGGTSVTNPAGSSSLCTQRVIRGGGWWSVADFCVSSFRTKNYPSDEYGDTGFRLFRTLSDDFESERSGEAVAAVAERAGTVCAGVSPAIAIIPLKPFEDGDVKLTDYAGEYDGEGHTIGVEATTAIAGLELAYAAGEGGSPGGLALPFGAELPLFTNVCEVTVWVEARAPGYITATNSATVKIGPRSITNATVAVGDVVFTGVPAEPVPSVTDGDPSIITTNDYTVAYSNNDLPGEGTVTLTGTGNYTGTTEAKFRIGVAELSVELGWKLLKATGTYFAQLKVTCTGGIAAGIDDLKFLFADRIGADGKTVAALWRTPLRAANPDTTTYGGATYRYVALDASQITAVGVPVTFGVADLASATIPVAERTIEMYVRTGVSPEGGNAGAAQVDDFVGYVVWTSGGVTRAVPVVSSRSQAAIPFRAVTAVTIMIISSDVTLPEEIMNFLPTLERLNTSLAVGVPLAEDSNPYCQVTAFSVEDGVMRGKVEVGADGRVGALGANATVTVLGAASPAGPFAEVSAVAVAADGSFSLAIPPGAKFFKLRIDVKEVVK